MLNYGGGPDGAMPFYFGRSRTSVQLRSCVFEMPMRRSKLQAAFAQGIFQSGALRIQLNVETPHLQEIGDAKKNFQVVQGLEQEIGGTSAERGPLGFLVRIGRKHDHREKDFAAGGAQGMENGKAIDMRHHQIEEDQVRREIVANFEEIGRAHV